MPPPIQLLDYVVDTFHLDVNPAYAEQSKDEVQALLETNRVNVDIEVNWTDPEQPDLVDLKASEDNAEEDAPGEVFLFHLTILVNDNDDFTDESLYRIRLRLAGMFSRPPVGALNTGSAGAERPDDDEYLLHTIASCTSMLYGSARNVVSSMTSQAPYDKLLLPPISPLQIASRVLSDEDG